MRQALGVAVFSGMIGVTLFGILLTPVFFYVIDTLSESRFFTHPTVRQVGRILLVVVYIAVCMTVLGAIGLFVSTLTEQPIAATIAGITSGETISAEIRPRNGSRPRVSPNAASVPSTVASTATISPTHRLSHVAFVHASRVK